MLCFKFHLFPNALSQPAVNRFPRVQATHREQKTRKKERERERERERKRERERERREREQQESTTPMLKASLLLSRLVSHTTTLLKASFVGRTFNKFCWIHLSSFFHRISEKSNCPLTSTTITSITVKFANKVFNWSILNEIFTWNLFLLFHRGDEIYVTKKSSKLLICIPNLLIRY